MALCIQPWTSLGRVQPAGRLRSRMIRWSAFTPLRTPAKAFSLVHPRGDCHGPPGLRRSRLSGSPTRMNRIGSGYRFPRVRAWFGRDTNALFSESQWVKSLSGFSVVRESLTACQAVRSVVRISITSAACGGRRFRKSRCGGRRLLLLLWNDSATCYVSLTPMNVLAVPQLVKASKKSAHIASKFASWPGSSICRSCAGPMG